MYNKFSIEAVTGKDKKTGESALAILVKFEDNEILCPIIQCKDEENQLNSIKEHIRIANVLINTQIKKQIESETPKIITS